VNVEGRVGGLAGQFAETEGKVAEVFGDELALVLEEHDAAVRDCKDRARVDERAVLAGAPSAVAVRPSVRRESQTH
jgi:hypothetical protein